MRRWWLRYLGWWDIVQGPAQRERGSSATLIDTWENGKPYNRVAIAFFLGALPLGLVVIAVRAIAGA